MSDKNPPDKGPVTDPQELERVMGLAAEDPGLMGPLMRMLLEARLWVYVPPHPELEGTYTMDVRDGFTWNTYRDEDGEFAAVFTSLRAAQDERRRRFHDGKKKPAMVEMPARVLLGFLNNGRTTVRIMASNMATISLDPEGIREALAGGLSEQQPPPPPKPGTAQMMTLVPVPPDDVPSKLRQAIRIFCTQRQGAVAVYVCNPQDEATGTVNDLDLRVLLRLRDNAGYFYNDFYLMVNKNTPKPYETSVGVPSAAQWEEDQMRWLRDACPVWPVMRAS